MRRDRRHEHAILSEGAAIATTTEAHTSERTLKSILVHVTVAPVTSENLVVSLDSGRGANYDAIVYSVDLAGVTDIAFTDVDMPLFIGDGLKVTYTNTDARTLSVRLVLED